MDRQEALGLVVSDERWIIFLTSSPAASNSG